MSRTYEMDVLVRDVSLDQVELITAAAKEEWPFSDWYRSHDGCLSASGVSTLGGGEAEEEFADRLAQAIWKAAGRCLEVSVNAYYLEDLPYETHVRGEEQYNLWKKEHQNAETRVI